jgi:DNA-binding MarR family transcriptional regulator
MMTIEEEIKSKFRNETQKAIINIIYTGNKVQEAHFRIFKKHGLTSPQYNVLRILRGQAPNPSNINLLIDRMLDKMSNASRTVDKLESKKLVTRSQSEVDRRSVDVFITEKGLELLNKIDQEVNYVDEKVKGFTAEDGARLNELLDKLRNSF